MKLEQYERSFTSLSTITLNDSDMEGWADPIISIISVVVPRLARQRGFHHIIQGGAIVSEQCPSPFSLALACLLAGKGGGYRYYE